jgi:hypothetical protein
VSDNGRRPPFDPSGLTPNDLRRLRASLDGRNPQEVLASGVFEDVYQTVILAHKLRSDASFTWEAAGDVDPSTMFDMSGGDAEPPPPPGGPPGSPGPEAAPPAATSSRKRRTGSAPAPGFAASTASPATSTTS